MRAPFVRAARDELGQAAVLVSLAMVVLMGAMAIAFDIGRIYMVRVHAQNTADAAALAGAESLYLTGNNQAAAKMAAQTTASQNFPGAPLVIAIPTPTTVQVTLRPVVQNYFARVLGIPTTTVVTTASAQIGAACPVDAQIQNCQGPGGGTSGSPPPSCGSTCASSPPACGSACGALFRGLMPWAVYQATLDACGTISPATACTVTLKLPGGGGTTGNYNPVDLEYVTSTATSSCLPGAPTYKTDIEDGSPTPHFVGDYLCTETGDMAGPTKQGVAGLLTNCQMQSGTQCDSPGIWVVVPIVSGSPPNGKTTVQVINFAVALITPAEITAAESTAQVTATFEYVACAVTCPNGMAPPWTSSFSTLTGS